MRVNLEIDPVFCGPVSVGTISVIKLVREYFDLDLAVAKAFVDRAVAGERVSIPAPSSAAACRFVEALAALPSEARVRAVISDQ